MPMLNKMRVTTDCPATRQAGCVHACAEVAVPAGNIFLGGRP